MANSLDNLRPVRTTEEARERGRKGGIASGKSKRRMAIERKIIKEEIEKRMTEADWDEYIGNIIARAKETKADAEFLRDTIGQKPKDEVSLDANMVFEVEINED